MRILIVSNIKENGYGESTRPYFIGNGLADLGHKILHVCEKSGREGNRVAFFRRDSLKTPFAFLDRILNPLWFLIRVNIFRPDVIYVHQLNNWNWVRLSRALPKSLRVYDSHTSVYFEHGHFGATGDRHEITFVREQNAVSEPDRVITVSSETKKILSELYAVADEKISIVKNATQIRPIGEPVFPTNAKFICTSVLPIDGFPSNDMALEMLLEIAAQTEAIDPNITFVVIGGGKKPEPQSNNVLYTGFVEDFETEILKSNICLASYPEKAVCGGVRNKVCDFMALAQAIVSTTEGMRGFDDAIAGTDYVLANTPEEFVSEILRLKKDSDRIQQLKLRSLVLGKKYQWSNRVKEVEAIFESLTTRS
ncbi:MAG: glycosyltransferase family 4 protein [Flavobacteriales bacterium]|nr:glycosyltransferase family 4 protein [Flavobacteriales bacterium]